MTVTRTTVLGNQEEWSNWSNLWRDDFTVLKQAAGLFLRVMCSLWVMDVSAPVDEK